MAKSRSNKSAKTNKFCGEKGCKLGYEHWHSGNMIRLPMSDDVARRLGPQPITPLDLDAEAIAAAVLALPCSDDPDADRFEGKTPEEIQITILREHVAKDFKELRNVLEQWDATDVHVREHFLAQLKDFRDLLDRLSENEVDRAEAFRCKLDAIADTLNRTVEVDAIGAVDAKLENIGKAQGEAWSTLRLMKDYIEMWKGADAVRHAEDGKTFTARYDKIMSLLQTINYNIGHKPGFWTIFFATMAGGAGLLSLMTVIAVVAFLLNNYFG